MGNAVFNTVHLVRGGGDSVALTNVDIKVHELQSEELPVLALGPYQEHASCHSRDEVMGAPPALDAGSVHLQYRLAYGQRTVVPDQ